MAKVTGSNFFDKLREYANDAEVADEEARRFVNLFDRVFAFHDTKADNPDTVTIDPNADKTAGDGVNDKGGK